MSEQAAGPLGESHRKPGLERLVWVVERLLGPGGCPWDQAQTHESLKKHLIEESYEVCDAIDRADGEGLRDELGDLLLQPLMHAEMRRLAGEWDIDEVAERAADKLVRRHPHVFGDATANSPEEVLANWDRIKSEEKGEPRSALAGVPRSMPGLHRAYEISLRAARVGFDWPEPSGIFDKLREEETELRSALESEDKQQAAREIGDILFVIVNLARWHGIEPEDALHKMLDRFSDRFRQMEERAEGRLTQLDAEEWDRLWNLAKASE